MKNRYFDPQFDQLKHELHTIFVYYCSFGDRDNFTCLKVQNYRRLLLDAQLIDNDSEHPHLDIIYASHKKQAGITFNNFLELLPEAIAFLTHQEIKVILDNNFHALYEYIIESTELGQCIRTIKKGVFTESSFILFKEISQTIQRIFIHYFDPFQIKTKNDPFKCLTKFTREFQITPQLMTITQSYLVFQFLEKEQAFPVYEQWFHLQGGQKDHHRMFFRFLLYLIAIGCLVGNKIYGVELSSIRKLSTFLEVMEVSRGFTKLCKQQKINLHLILSEQFIKKLDQDPIETLQSSPDRKQAHNLQFSRFVTMNYSEMRKKFIGFCVQGQTLGQTSLTHKKAIDLLLLMEIGLKQNEIEIYLAHSGAKHIGFEIFLSILEKIEEKENIPAKQLFQRFLYAPLHEQFEADQLRTSRIYPNFSKQEYRVCLSMIQAVDLLLTLIFRLNCEPHSTSTQLSFISLNSYLKIMHEFEVSPLYLKKTSLVQIFQKSIKKSQEFMGYSEFKDSFIIALPYVDDTQPERMDERLILILEKMNDSRGAKKLEKVYPYEVKEDYLLIFRSKFSHHYKRESERDRQVGENLLRRILQ